MRTRVSNALLFIVAVLLAANLVQPLFQTVPAHADDHEGGDMALTGSGASAFLVKGSQVYYIKFETQFESIRIYGPEEIEN
ncbi:MAG: hypothetical protein CME26_03650 [Gemmatimonadetes bacterium]|nr:hypothetical protein [Gemmatimonadota bacterium]|tara:strand:+ start:7442 stop:7684 length:243 start_codon:yes stop_codon:yes gene_type:complete